MCGGGVFVMFPKGEASCGWREGGEEEGRRDGRREDFFVVFSVLPLSPFLISPHTNRSFSPNRKEEKDGEVFMDI